MIAKIHSQLIAGQDVLIVDDDTAIRQLIVDVLQIYDARTHQAGDGVQGYQMALQLRPLFILSDLAMPDMDGWDMVGALKQNPITRSIPVIAMTGNNERGNYERALIAGFDHYLTKPFSPTTFITDLMRIVARLHDTAATVG
ncbi:MAG: response regulator [Chloroflexota bacterium]|nr:response regulator [Chloroflexota bacterium]